MNVPDDLKYAETHEWIRVKDGVGAVGITDHAQEELTDIVFVDPPKAGAAASAKAVIAVVESVKAASDIYSPVSGEVIESNPRLESEPGLLNSDPYGDGWIYTIRLSDMSEVDRLKSSGEYVAQIKG